MDTTTLPVTYLEGIGPATAGRLATIDVYSVADLVRADVNLVRAATGGRVSAETAERWRGMALLVEIAGCDNQLSEALTRSGVYSTEQVWQRDASEQMSLFQSAADQGIIPRVPDMETIHGMRLDAAVLHFSASLNGTVVDSAGEPVEGATVDIGGRSYQTDPRGRFRANRIPQGRATRLLIRHPGFESVLVEDVPVLPDDALVRVERFLMGTPLADGRSPSAILLCEWQGDPLPPISHEPMTTRAMGGADTLREGDVLVLHRYYAHGADAQLASKFLQFDDGRFVTLHWRVPLDQLPDGHEEKQVFRYRRGEFRRLSLTPHYLRHLVAARRARKSGISGAPPTTPMEVDVSVGLMSDHYLEILGGEPV